MDTYPTFLERLREVILSHPNANVSLLMEQMHLSRTPLHNRIKSLSGMSTTAYIRFVRLSVACDLLLQSDLNVSEIAFQTGFQSHAYFTRCFSDAYGCTPSVFRQKRK